MENLNEVSPGILFTQDGLLSHKSNYTNVYTYLKNTVNSNTLNEMKNLAIQLHEFLCYESHTDGCSWHYEIENGNHQWYRSAHIDYLIMAYNCYNKHITVDNIEFIKRVTSLYV